MSTTTDVNPRRPAPELQARLRRVIDARGLVGAGRYLGLGREPMLRYLASVPMQAATFERVERLLAKLNGGRRGLLG